MSTTSSSQNNLFMQDPSYLRQAFAVLDRDGDGKIASSNLHEFFTVLLKKNVSKENIELMMSIADLDSKSSVEFEEFEKIIISFEEETKKKNNAVEGLQEPTLMEIFDVIDRDGDGIISLGDLREFMVVVMQEAAADDHVSEEEVEEMIKAAGGSVNSGICKQNFLTMMTAKILKNRPIKSLVHHRNM